MPIWAPIKSVELLGGVIGRAHKTDSMDPVSQKGALVAAKAVADADADTVLGKLLAPLATEIGDDLASVYRRIRESRRKRRNAANILNCAHQMVGQGDGLQPNPRVLHEILERASWTDSALGGCYFGGLLAGSRSEDGLPDSNMPWVTLVESLSTTEIFLHYLTYRAIATQFEDRGFDSELLEQEHLFWNLEVVVPEAYWTHGLGGRADSLNLLKVAVQGLRRVRVLGDPYQTAANGVSVSPTHPGAVLFLAAHGYRDPSPSELTGCELSLNPALDEQIAEIDREFDGKIPTLTESGRDQTWPIQ